MSSSHCGPDAISFSSVCSSSASTLAAFPLDVFEEAVATSGDYVQYFEHGGRRYHHLLDPRTGEPRSSSWRSVTVAAATCCDADAAATAVFGRGPERARRLLARWVPAARIGHMI